MERGNRLPRLNPVTMRHPKQHTCRRIDHIICFRTPRPQQKRHARHALRVNRSDKARPLDLQFKCSGGAAIAVFLFKPIQIAAMQSNHVGKHLIGFAVGQVLTAARTRLLQIESLGERYHSGSEFDRELDNIGGQTILPLQNIDGFSWAMENLPDLTVEIDYVKASVTVLVNDWDLSSTINYII